MWNQKQKRAFHRAKSGAKVAQILKQPIKHLVLTSSPEGGKRNIHTDFQTLRKRIYRKFGVLLSYFMVYTNEGNGVLHVLYREKQYLPQQWLSNQWDEIHLSSYVYIKQPPNDVARYVVTQYLADQGTSFQRCSWSHSWVCRGFVKAWRAILRQTSDWKHQYRNEYGAWCAHLDIKRALLAWEVWLMALVIKQKTLDDYEGFSFSYPTD